MLQTAGEVCDGVLLHSFGTFKYIREVAIPNLQKGAERAGRSIADIDVNGGGYVITGPSEERIERRLPRSQERNIVLRLYAQLCAGDEPSRLERYRTEPVSHVCRGQVGRDGRAYHR